MFFNEPFVLMFFGLSSAIVGFVLLFGPRKGPNNALLHNEVGVMFFFIGLGVFAVATYFWLQIALRTGYILW